MSKNTLALLPSKSFMVSGLTFRSLIYFIFVYCVRKFSSIIHLHIADQCLQHHILKETVPPSLYTLVSFVID